MSRVVSFIRRTGGAPLIIISAVIVTVIVMSTSSTPALTPYQLGSGASFVTLRVVGNTVILTVTLPPPTYYYYYYAGYYYYQQYYQYGGAGGIPVKVIAVIEKVNSGVHELKRLEAVQLYAYGTPNAANITFSGLEPGQYSVKVLFWNDFLAQIHSSGGQWIPLAHAYKTTVTIG